MSGDAGGDVLLQSVDDVGDTVGDAEKTFVAKRVRQAVDEPAVRVVRAGGAELGERFPGVGLDEMALVVLEVNDDAGRGREQPLVGEDEFADALARGPGVDEVGGAGVGEKAGLGQGGRVGRGNKQRVADRGDRLGAGGHGDDAGVAGGAEGVREAGDVIEAIRFKVAVVNKEDVHARRDGGSDRAKRKAERKTGLVGLEGAGGVAHGIGLGCGNIGEAREKLPDD